MNKITEATAISKEADEALMALRVSNKTRQDRFTLIGSVHDSRFELQERLFRLDRNMKRMLIRLIAAESGVNIRQTGMHTTRALYAVAFADDGTILQCIKNLAVCVLAEHEALKWQDQSTTS